VGISDIEFKLKGHTHSKAKFEKQCFNCVTPLSLLPLVYQNTQMNDI